MRKRNLAKGIIIAGISLLLFVVPLISAAAPAPKPTATPKREPAPPPGMTKVDIEILGAGRGGSGWALAIAYAAIINKYGPSWLRATGVETRGTTDNIMTLWKQKDRRPFTVFYLEETTSDASSLGLKSWGFPEKISPKPKVLTHALTGIHGFVSLDRKITKWSDLAGKKIVIDKVGASKNNTSMDMFSVADFKVDPLAVTLNEGLDLLIAGQVDAMNAPMNFIDGESGVPTDSIIQLLAQKPGQVNFISVPQEIVEKASKVSGIDYRYLEAPPKYFGEFNYPIGGYHYNLVWGVFPEFPDELAYVITKLTYEHIGEFKKYHAVGKGTALVSFGWITTPNVVHQGGLKFYQEKRIEVKLPVKPIDSIRKK